MPVTLESRTRRMQVFHLPHEAFCRDLCACADFAVYVVAENPRTGDRARKRVIKRVPGSITFLARERKADLPVALLELAQVKAAINRGYLRIVAQVPDGSAPPEAAAAAATGHVVAPGPPAAAASPAANASPSPGQPTQANTASPVAGQPAQPTAATTPTGATPAPAQPTAGPSPTPAASSSAASSPPAPHVPARAANPPGKEA